MILDPTTTVACERCGGSGKSDVDCPTCNGFGIVYLPLEEPCDSCAGTGKDVCVRCEGTGLEEVGP